MDDPELVRAAQAGDVSALGLLLARHRPGMTAVAISLLGYGHDAEDAVQEATAVALARIGDVRDPDAVGPWLRQVVRNACRMQLRTRRPLSLDDHLLSVPPSAEPDPAQLLEQHASRDWVWHALERLSPPLRLVVMLRHFSGVTAYQDIADACGVPVGTVRSRLSEARGKLCASLLATADEAYDDVTALAAVRRREVEETLVAAEQGTLAETMRAYWSPEAEFTYSNGHRSIGHDDFLRGLYQDIDDGVRGRVTNVVASQDLSICEIDLINPLENPLHCPPTVVWVQQLEAGRTSRCRLLHARRLEHTIPA
ncbi:sigma-70 family RNA polymerase sigma factor [Streptomyces sp. SID13031]|uniref:RNA polymerase sigma factor n=1 Tax=Streptomyces sp. SID13031 TaxID=2706046 RepID=UPI0013C6AC56|nr:sigma-70 family RNA polymerase sigma factor [Streptomyces sp. SID13031]NEA36768.1 sigma-70 family RNA polymerase sigma factor [Streptomyces sp. SID13031]